VSNVTTVASSRINSVGLAATALPETIYHSLCDCGKSTSFTVILT
jgi:hypothetical protein